MIAAAASSPAAARFHPAAARRRAAAPLPAPRGLGVSWTGCAFGAPSAAVIAMVAAHADQRQDLGGGRMLLRLSPAAARRVEGASAAQAARAGELGVVYDLLADEVVRVIDDAASRRAPADDSDWALWDITFGDDHALAA